MIFSLKKSQSLNICDLCILTVDEDNSYINEISELINGLINAFNLLPVGGIIAVVSFHSIEDKLVKFFFCNTFSMIFKW